MQKIIVLPLDGFSDSKKMLDSLKENFTPELEKFVAYIKVNDAVHDPHYGGPSVIKAIDTFLKENFSSQNRTKIFLDLKIFDVEATVINTLKKYQDLDIGILTVSSQVSQETVSQLHKLLPNTKLALVSVPTDISPIHCRLKYGAAPELKILTDIDNIRHNYSTDGQEPFDLVVCSGNELEFLKRNLPHTYGFIVPGIRDEWMLVDHQKRTMGVREALDKGANYLVMGAQLLKGNPEKGISASDSRQLTELELKKSRRFSQSLRDPLTVLTDCQGYYKSKVDSDGNPCGPVVGYAGTYQDNGDVKNYVGLEYFNFAKAEENPDARAYFAKLIAQKVRNIQIKFTNLLGAPMGGIMLATELSSILNVRSGFIEKKVTHLADEENGRKEASRLVIDRHELNAGDRVILIEDVCNNFSTTEKVRDLIKDHGAELVAIVCAFNRSQKECFDGIPVISALHIPSLQFKQDVDIVRKLIEEKKVVWKPKLQWDELCEAMK